MTAIIGVSLDQITIPYYNNFVVIVRKISMKMLIQSMTHYHFLLNNLAITVKLVITIVITVAHLK